jgi:LMBR1 domain-containing protein 1
VIDANVQSQPISRSFFAHTKLLSTTTTMADVFLIVSITVAFLILFVVAVYLLVYYQHPDDHNEAYFPKGVVIFGIVLAGATALLLPLDVANNEGYAGT